MFCKDYLKSNFLKQTIDNYYFFELDINIHNNENYKGKEYANIPETAGGRDVFKQLATEATGDLWGGLCPVDPAVYVLRLI